MLAIVPFSLQKRVTRKKNLNRTVSIPLCTCLKFIKLNQCKPWDPIGIANECTLINTIFCKPDDGRTKPKHVA